MLLISLNAPFSRRQASRRQKCGQNAPARAPLERCGHMLQRPLDTADRTLNIGQHAEAQYSASSRVIVTAIGLPSTPAI
jgi:hypothetical protein